MKSNVDVKWVLKRLAVGVGRRVLMPRSGARVVVLCYHSVSPNIPFTSASPKKFEQHLTWLKDHCDVVCFKNVMDRAASDSRHGRPIVAITFDDGYADNYEFAFPLLRRYGLPATFFLTAGLVDKDPTVIERFCALRRSPREGVRALEWSEAREMHRAGMEIGAHTYSHPNLAHLDHASAEIEVRRSKELIEERLGVRITSMAYPFGKPRHHFTSQTMDIVSTVGYERAAAVVFRAVSVSHSRFALPRFIATQDGVEALRDKVMGAWDLVGLWQEHARPIGMRNGN